MEKKNFHNWPYVFWFAFYFTLFWIMGSASYMSFLLVSAVYGIAILFALTPLSESIWRAMSGIRPYGLTARKNG